MVRCKGCNETLGEGPDSEPRTPCPKCGSTIRIYEAHVVDSVRALDSLGFKLKRPGRKRPAVEGTSGYDRTAEGRLVKKQSLFDREGDRRFEHVEDDETGEVLHHSDHKLTEHRGHGADKFPPKKKGDG